MGYLNTGHFKTSVKPFKNKIEKKYKIKTKIFSGAGFQIGGIFLKSFRKITKIFPSNFFDKTRDSRGKNGVESGKKF